MSHETDAVYLEPKDWETRVDAYDGARGDALRHDLQEILGPADIAEEERAQNIVGATSNAAEIVAVFEGRKPLFHEQYGEKASPYASAIKPFAPRGVDVDTFDGHVVVYRQDIVRKIIASDPAFYAPNKESVHDAIVRAIDHDSLGELLGYGERQLLGKNSVFVSIYDGNVIVAGFFAPGDSWQPFAEARLEDYERFLKKTLTIKVGDPIR